MHCYSEEISPDEDINNDEEYSLYYISDTIEGEAKKKDYAKKFEQEIYKLLIEK